jgi:hypothetical protein
MVLDAPIVASWFQPDGAGRALRAEYEAGALEILGPRHLPQDVLAALALHADADGDLLGRIGLEIERLGLPAHRAAYAALAAELDLPLVSDDEELRGVAGPRARSSGDA